MKLRKVEKARETGYPTYLNYLKNHKKELGIIAAGVSLLFTPGCDENKTIRTGGKPQPPIAVPVDKPVTLDGEIAAPIPPKPQNCPNINPPMIKGKMAAPKPVEKKRGEMPAPKPPEKK